MAAAFAMPAHAVDWRFEPSIGATATYTDNANRSDSDPEDALILTVRPGFSLRSEGLRRVKASLAYALSGVARFGEDQSTDVNHNLAAIGKAELVEDFLFVDGSASISQELISLFGSPAEADVNDSNRATVGTYSISPYIMKRLGSFANVQVRYTTSGAIFERDTAADSSANAFSAKLSSGTRFHDLSWGLNYSLRKAENRNAATTAANADTSFESASATVGYALTRKFRVFGTAGADWYDYGTTKVDGSSYSVGFGWAPTRRTSVEASAGERYFGRTYSFSGSHRTRQSQWTVRYYEDVSDISQQFNEQSSRTFWKCPVGGFNVYQLVTDPDQPPASNCGGPYTPLELLNFASPQELRSLYANLALLGDLSIGTANGIFIIKGLTAGVSWDLGRLGLGLSAQDTRRLYQLFGNAEEHVQGVTGSVSYRMSPKTTASGSLSLTRNSADALLAGGAARDDELLGLTLGINHRFADKLNGALTFRHTERDSSAANSDFKENSVMASVSMRF